MTIKRETKRRARQTLYIILMSILGVLVLILLFYLGKSASTLLSPNYSQGKLIRPLGSTISISALSNKLAQKNIIMDSLVEASESGIYIGVIKDGPTVYFSQNQDLSWQVLSVALILQRTTVDNKKPQIIDLTTNRPIVKF